LANTKKLAIGAALIATCLVIVFLPNIRDGYRESQDQRRVSDGRELARVYCSSCHLEPSPDILPKKSWEVALAYMGYMMGLDNIDYLAGHPEFAQENVKSKRTYLVTENMIPDAALLSESDWATLRYYFVKSAAEEPLPQAAKPALRWELPQFNIIQSNYRADPAVTTMVHVREETAEAYIGDSVEMQPTWRRLVTYLVISLPRRGLRR